MKKNYTILLAAATLLFAACDPGYTCDNVINNASNHKVSVIPLAYEVYSSHRDISAHDTVYLYDITVLDKNEKSFVMSSGGLGSASREECIYNMRQYLGDSVKFLFDNEKSIVFYATDTSGVSPYNFDAPFYHYVQKLRVRRGNVGDPYYGTLTLNIDDDFYQLAN